MNGVKVIPTAHTDFTSQITNNKSQSGTVKPSYLQKNSIKIKKLACDKMKNTRLCLPRSLCKCRIVLKLILLDLE